MDLPGMNRSVSKVTNRLDFRKTAGSAFFKDFKINKVNSINL